MTRAAEGRDVYAQQCASCHGMNLLGNESGPALSGKAFQDRWASRRAGQLFDVTTTSMPSTNPGGLAARDYAAILAYMLYENGYVASTTDLDLSSQVAHSVAIGHPSTGQQPPPPAVSTLSNTMTEWLHLGQRPIHQVFDLPSKIEGGRRDQLRHKNGVDIFDGVNPEQRRGQTAPIKVALANRP